MSLRDLAGDSIATPDDGAPFTLSPMDACRAAEAEVTWAWIDLALIQRTLTPEHPLHREGAEMAKARIQRATEAFQRAVARLTDRELAVLADETTERLGGPSDGRSSTETGGDR